MKISFCIRCKLLDLKELSVWVCRVDLSEDRVNLHWLCFFGQDDIIDDVDSFLAAAETLKERGAYKIFVMATHGLLSSDAPRLIEESAIDEVSMDSEFLINVLGLFGFFFLSKKYAPHSILKISWH